MDLFPTGLDNSLFPAIFIGVLLTFIAVETLGWTFTGLVVPGYLASVALVAPRAAGLMVIEALITVLIVRILSDGIAEARIGSRFFGRERFFMTLAIATGVRLAVDHALLPVLVENTGVFGQFAFTEGDLPAHSIGLVLVPLLAHTFDKVGPIRGIQQMGVLTAITGAVVYVLVKTTNLTLGDLTLTFEDVAFAIDQSPKSYVVLLCGALLAARANVAFGWDFHGIIVPGLLAVAWFTPGKVAVTLVEALAALALAKGILMLPWLRHLQVEGPRRLVVIFVADAFLKVAIVALAGTGAPTINPSDLYGFGYLLPTLLASKIWQKGSIGRVVLPATQVSLGGFLLGNALLFVFARAAIWLAPAQAQLAVADIAPLPMERAAALARSYVARDGERTRLPFSDAEVWRGAWKAFANGEAPREAFAPLIGKGLVVAPLSDEEGGIALLEQAPRLAALRGLGTIIARPTGKEIIVAVPRPLENDASLAAIDVARALDARGLVVSGRPDAEADFGAAFLATPYGVAKEEMSRGWLELVVDEKAPAAGILRVGTKQWPAALDAKALQALMPGLEIAWTGVGGGVVLAAPTASWRALASRPCADGAVAPMDSSIKDAVAAPGYGEDLFLGERLLFAERVMQPIVRAARSGDARAAAEGCRAAQALGLDVRTIRDGEGALHVAVLPGVRHGASVVVRVSDDPRAEHIVGAPEPKLQPYARHTAIAMYQLLGGRALILGAPAAPVRASTYDAALDVVASVSDEEEAIAVEVRGASVDDAQAIIAWGGLAGTPDTAPRWVTPVEKALAQLGVPATRWDGSALRAPLSGMDSARRAAFARLGKARLATIYLPMDVRQGRFAPSGEEGAATLATSLGLARAVKPLDAVFTATDAPCVSLAEPYGLARRYAELRHIGDLKRLVASPGVSLAVDPASGEAAFVAASSCDGRREAFAVSLRDLGGQPVEVTGTPDDDTRTRLRHGGVTALFARMQ